MCAVGCCGHNVRTRRRALMFLLSVVSSLLLLHVYLRGLDADQQISELLSYKQQYVRQPVHGLIPRILHQTYKTAEIPEEYGALVGSWLRTQLNFTYVFWTDENIEHFVRDKFPHLSSLMQAYPHSLQRSDAVRYLILLYYGGMYADMDVEALKSFDPLISQYSCILSREPFAQTMFLWSAPQSVMNAIMACAPHHSFMRTMVGALPILAQRWHLKYILGIDWYHSYIIWSTGPMALTEVYNEYVAVPLCDQLTDPLCQVWLAPPSLLLPQLKNETFESIRSFCEMPLSWLIRPFFVWQDRACRAMEQALWSNIVPAHAYSRHIFSNVGYNLDSSAVRKTVSIKTLVPTLHQYPNIPFY